MRIGKKERHIPVPKKQNGPKGIYVPIFAALEIGESQVLYDVHFGGLEKAINTYNKTHNGQCIVSAQVKKTSEDTGDKRIWRLA